jgi:hypothetical protein
MQARLRGAACLFFATALIRFARMNKTVIEVQVRAVLPTSGGCAVFLGNNDKVFIIYVDQTVGSAITMFMRDVSKERPLTHDLMGHLMTALGAKVERVISPLTNKPPTRDTAAGIPSGDTSAALGKNEARVATHDAVLGSATHEHGESIEVLHESG